MKASKWHLTIVLAATLAVTAGSALAQRGRGGRGGGQGGPNKGTGVAGSYNFAGEWAEMVGVAKFDVFQKEALEKALEARDNALKECDKANDEAAKASVAAKTDDERKAAQEQMDKIKTARANVERNTRAKAFEIMRPEQKQVWTGYCLLKVFKESLASLDPKLTDDQMTKIKAICELAGGKTPTADVLTNKPLLGSVQDEIVAKVLTDDQKKNLPDKFKELAAPTKDPTPAKPA